MKKSARALRMERHHRRMSQTSKLSLVSLMDIFTILVFFLIVNASNVQVLESNKTIILPKSAAQQEASERLLLLVNNQQLILQGQAIADLSQFNQQSPSELTALSQALAQHRAALSEEEKQGAAGREITIMGDKSIPYAMLKLILQSCAQSGYTDIALAVESEPKASDGMAAGGSNG